MITRSFLVAFFARVSQLLSVTMVLSFAVGPLAAQDVGKRQSHLFASRSLVWDSPTIPVCWEQPTPHNQNERTVVRQAVARTWERVSTVRFTGWNRCFSGSDGIRIKVADEGPHVKVLGKHLNGVADGMVLNFTFNNWGTECRNRRPFCIDVIAVHEFGHALGLAHEQNRPDTPGWCADERQGPDGDLVMSPFDMQSVMNYCNPNWNGDGQLSHWDIEGIRWLYGGAFRWTHDDALDGMVCTQILEPSDDHTWGDNYLCVENTAPRMDWQWSSRGAIPGMRCTQILEPSESGTWSDNYLCVPPHSPIRFRWSSNGPLAGLRCTQILEPADSGTWTDNYLCVDAATPRRFHWSFKGALAVGECVRWNEPSDSDGWDDNYLCVEGTPAFTLRWSFRGAIPGMRCTQFYEPSDSDGWDDNYLCVPRESPLQFLWSSNGALPGIPCWKIDEPSDPDTWQDNYLCMHRPQPPPSPSYTLTQPYLPVAPGLGRGAIDVSGAWSSNAGLVYEVSQRGATFDWRVEGRPQIGYGTVLDERAIRASWRDPDGGGTGSAHGRIAEVDAGGRALRIEWNNGVVFTRSTGGGVALPPAQGKAAVCEAYARTAVTQNAANQERACGFEGPRWSSDLQGHRAWCLRVDAAQAQEEQRARETALRDACPAQAPGGGTAFCDQYARAAVEQQRINEQRGCGFSGPRWGGDYQAHQAWCRVVDRTQAEGEQQAREKSLQECR